ncbi:MAG: hypothetical protein KGD68_10085 [Candidatus Lokiarchaeota archaeon]|nr:hypothetical protein [Candidatus Lokiarchaeota archaeon]
MPHKSEISAKKESKREQKRNNFYRQVFQPKILELFHLNRILDELVNSGYVKKKEINDKDYFYYE